MPSGLLFSPTFKNGRAQIERAPARLFHAAAGGIVMTLLGINVEERDLSLSDSACEMALAPLSRTGKSFLLQLSSQ